MRLHNILALLAAILMAAGCTRTIYTPIETRTETLVERTDTLQTEKISKLIDELKTTATTREKVVIRDSVVYVVNQQGEVLSRESFRDKDRDYSESVAIERVTQVYDSLLTRQATRIDSLLSEFRQEPVVIEKKPSFWSQIKAGLAVGAVCVLILGALIGVFFLWRWLKSKFFY